MNIYKLHEYLLEIQLEEHFNEDILELYFLGVATEEEKKEYCNSRFNFICIDEYLLMKKSIIKALNCTPSSKYKNDFMLKFAEILDIKMPSCLFEIEQELFQVLDGIPENKYKNNLMFFISIILEMRIEKLKFEKMKQERGKNWKTREKPKKKINRRKYPSLDGMQPLETPDEIIDTSCEIYTQEFEYKEKLPLGYETEWYGNIKKEFTDIVFETRQEYKLPKNEKIILEAISKIYNKL